MFVLLGMQSVSSKNYLEVKCSSATSKSYTFQKVRISREMGLNYNLISQNTHILLWKGENISQKSNLVVFL